jgi:hypothetical protein
MTLKLHTHKRSPFRGESANGAAAVYEWPTIRTKLRRTGNASASFASYPRFMDVSGKLVRRDQLKVDFIPCSSRGRGNPDLEVRAAGRSITMAG